MEPHVVKVDEEMSEWINLNRLSTIRGEIHLRSKLSDVKDPHTVFRRQ